jgi:hypothetical protein
MSIPAYVFSPGETIESTKVNANFAQLALMVLRSGDTFTGTMRVEHLLADAFNTYDLGSLALAFRSVFTKTLKLVDTGNDHILSVIVNENLGANRILNLILGDATRTLTFTADASIGGTNTGDKLGVKVISGDTGAATANAQEDTLSILTGNDAIITAGASKTITIKGPKIQTALAWTDLDTDAYDLQDPGPTDHGGTDFYYGMSDRGGGYWSTETIACAKDGFLVVECQTNGLAAGSVQFYVTNSPAVPPDSTTILGRISFSDYDGASEAGTLTIPVKAGSSILLYLSQQPTSDIRVIQARFYPIYAA